MAAWLVAKLPESPTSSTNFKSDGYGALVLKDGDTVSIIADAPNRSMPITSPASPT